MTTLLGRLERVPLREVWEHEASNFTPWLAHADNISLLAGVLHLGDLVVEATEKDVGRFSADIVARDEEGNLVLIENQLEPTDHRHLGQILTYLAGLSDTATVVWIAREFLEEHRAAIDWLNANTIDRYSFFGVEIEVVKITGSSALAANFNVVAKPNDWSRRVGSTARRLGETPVNDKQRLYEEYWALLGERFSKATGRRVLTKPNRANWYSFGIGGKGFSLSVVLNPAERWIRAELWIGNGLAKAIFQEFLKEQEAIEKEYGSTLEWEELPTRKGARISAYLRDQDVSVKTTWPEQHDWLVKQLENIRRVFQPRIRSIDFSSLRNVYGESEETDMVGVADSVAAS
ncbi:DUF4268 domain-containing protein [Microvirga tunisiensis]|uniref:DUF4268 domain-containing protein n=1 Tax=Microvirga tunisiensis TaxID=2108360 RepID=UPI0013866DFE